MIWHPQQRRFSSSMTLTASELENVVGACIQQGVSPFVFTLDEDDNSTVYHPELKTGAQLALVRTLGIEGNVNMLGLDELPADAAVTHVNSIGLPGAIKSAATAVIGHHDEEGIARFLRQRLALDEA